MEAIIPKTHGFMPVVSKLNSLHTQA
jgi:hypothetical protein